MGLGVAVQQDLQRSAELGGRELAGETEWRVPSLSLPPVERAREPNAALAQCDALRLFIERARQARSNFAISDDNAPAVAQICHQLDGIPLAIELAAARIRMLSLEQIAVALVDRFRLLTGGARSALPRQQTLRASVDWSYALLSEDERILFRRLGVLAGGFTLDAAETIGTGEGLDAYAILVTQHQGRTAIKRSAEARASERRPGPAPTLPSIRSADRL